MPPAFNLSQDQTLQFNLCCYNKVLFVKTGFTQTEYLTYIIYFRVSTWLDIAFHAPTLIGCLFVKDRFRIILLFDLSVALFVAVVVTSAEKRDYEQVF